ncbi:hypothetical protein SLEP1_g27233 [Rubroshorea leprosula]|uniref:Uncharacterized protein n=1 Tax=Rubroshorea leprosula TaxID=152421 RepID=A0AAV5JPS2_9ROSI|nr:hypothetical protein SLEP1_g27233 [Rubroshorea leprosula]
MNLSLLENGNNHSFFLSFFKSLPSFLPYRLSVFLIHSLFDSLMNIYFSFKE